MDFIKLKIQNFMTIGDAVTIQLKDRGLNLLQGQNNDDPSAKSNGAGKSSIADALCWALYGSTARGDSADAVVNDTRKKDCYVQVDIEDGDSEYTITRYRKHAKGKNSVTLDYQNSAGAARNLTKGTDKETQAEIEAILGCSEDVFIAAIYAGQENMPDLPGMTDKHLKMLIEQAAGVLRLEKAYEIAKTKLTVTERARSAEKVIHDGAVLQLGKLKVDLEVGKLKHKEFEDGREGRAASFNAQAKLLLEEAAVFVTAIQKVDKDALTQELADINAKLTSIAQASKTAADYHQTTVVAAQRAEAKHGFECSALETVAKAQRHDYDHAEEAMSKPCGACGKPHTADELTSFREHTKALLTESVRKLHAALEEQKAAKKVLDAVTARHAELVAEIPDASALQSRQKEINDKLLIVQRADTEARTRIERAKSFKAQAEQQMTAPNPHQSVIELCEQNIAANEKTRDESLVKLAEHDTKVVIAEAVAATFSPAGVRAHILDTVTPFLNERTAEYLATLSDGNISAVWSTLSKTAKGELREKFEIAVTNDKGGQSFRSISGGEKRKVRLACMLALQDLVASRATKPIRLWIGDEIDDALDESGLERLMTILQQKAREKGTVLVISHNSLRDWIDDVTLVKKSGGVSTVEGSLVV